MLLISDVYVVLCLIGYIWYSHVKSISTTTFYRNSNIIVVFNLFKVTIFLLYVLDRVQSVFIIY